MDQGTLRGGRRALLSWVGAAFLGLAVWAAPIEAVHPLEEGRQAWQERAEGFDGDWAQPEAIGRTVRAFESALESDPTSLESHEELLRALYFMGTFTELSEEAGRAVFVRGVEVAESAMRLLHGTSEIADLGPEELVDQISDRPQAGALHFWSAVHWGSWADRKGIMAALRQGVAKRLRLHAQVAAILNELYDNAGPHRFLGRLHAVAPKVPGFTGWVDRKKAVELLTRAQELVPEDPNNELFLIEAWLDHEPKKHPQARARLEALVVWEPRSESLVEDAFALKDARERLAAEKE